MDGLYRAVGENKRNNASPQYCDACFSGDYAITLTDQNGGPIPAQLSLLTEQDHCAPSIDGAQVHVCKVGTQYAPVPLVLDWH